MNKEEEEFFEFKNKKFFQMSTKQKQRTLLDCMEQGKLNYVEFLLNSFDFRLFLTSVNMTIVHLIKQGRSKMLKLLSNYYYEIGNVSDAFYLACATQEKEFIQEIMGQVKEYDKGLFALCIAGNREIAEYIVSKGANKFDSAMFYAGMGGSKEMVEFLVEKGAKDWKAAIKGCKHSKDNNFREWIEQKFQQKNMQAFEGSIIFTPKNNESKKEEIVTFDCKMMDIGISIVEKMKLKRNIETCLTEIYGNKTCKEFTESVASFFHVQRFIKNRMRENVEQMKGKTLFCVQFPFF